MIVKRWWCPKCQWMSCVRTYPYNLAKCQVCGWTRKVPALMGPTL